MSDADQIVKAPKNSAQWILLAALALGGAGGIGGLGAQAARSGEVTKEDMAEKADKDDVQRIEAKVDKLTDAVTELMIAVRTAKQP